MRGRAITARKLPSNAMNKAEQEDQDRVRKANEFLTYCREAEDQARNSLYQATTRTKRAKEKFEQIFAECEARMVARRKAGLVTVTAGY